MIPTWALTNRVVDGRRCLALATPWLLVFLSQLRRTFSVMVLNRQNAGFSLAIGWPLERPNVSTTKHRTRYAFWLVALTVWRDNGADTSRDSVTPAGR